MDKLKESMKKMLEFYTDRLGRNTQHDVYAWESREAQNARFDALIDNVDLKGKKILDVGCGFGDLYVRLQKKGIDVDYCGLDISCDMIEKAQKRHPDVDFYCIDLLNFSDFKNNEFDIVFSSGVFNLNVGYNFELIEKLVEKFLFLANEKVVFNLLHERSKEQEKKYFYTTPDRIGIILNEFEITKITIIDDYLHNDYTLILDV